METSDSVIPSLPAGSRIAPPLQHAIPRRNIEEKYMANYTRTPFLIVHREHQARKDVYGSVDDALVLQAQLLRGEAPSKTALVGMHPIGAPGYLPIFSQLARSGHHVIACASRYTTGDASLQMENVILDVAACVRDARERLGYEKIVLVGWSGGGALMAGFQAEAEKPIIQQTASSEATPLAGATLIPADALMLVASHRSRHHLITGQLDASIQDELRPEDKNAEFDLYDPVNPAQPPYSEEFVRRYRDAQLKRNRRISGWAKDKLAALKRSGNEAGEHCFVVHGTMADPRWLDPTLDPNDRKANSTYMGEPRIVNNSPAALGRYTSLRSWLSQYSFDDAQIDSVDAGPRISVPSLIVTATADNACPTSHTDEMFNALGAVDKRKVTIKGANHYFSGPEGRSHIAECMTAFDQWLEPRGFAPAS
jgi:alpha-beta hydrolase superfamily lysophospholipase